MGTQDNTPGGVSRICLTEKVVCGSQCHSAAGYHAQCTEYRLYIIFYSLCHDFLGTWKTATFHSPAMTGWLKTSLVQTAWTNVRQTTGPPPSTWTLEASYQLPPLSSSSKDRIFFMETLYIVTGRWIKTLLFLIVPHLCPAQEKKLFIKCGSKSSVTWPGTLCGLGCLKPQIWSGNSWDVMCWWCKSGQGRGLHAGLSPVSCSSQAPALGTDISAAGLDGVEGLL